MLSRQNTILVVLVILLAFMPLVWQKGADFGGSDDKAKEMVAEVSPGYQPWMTNIWEPPSSEVESFLFALQAALGAGFLGYFFGYYRGRKKNKEADYVVAVTQAQANRVK
jgi:cobalt/nickel transport protein